MRIPRKICFLVLALLAIIEITRAEEENLDDVGYDDSEEGIDEKLSTSLNVDDGYFQKKETALRNAVSAAVRIPEKQVQISQVLPIIRSMSPPQKRAMAVLVSTRMSHNDSTLPFDQVEMLFGADSNKNITKDLMLPISMDIAKIITDDIPEELPEAQELRYVPHGKRRRPLYQSPPRRQSTMIRRNVHPEGLRSPFSRPGRRPTEIKRSPTEQECKFFSSTVCLEAADYPHEAIMRSIRSNKEMISALLADYKSQSSSELHDDGLPLALPLELNKYENRFESNEIKRSDTNSPYADNVEEGFTCPSQIRYARPQLARAASGAWKYIINTGEHTQTLRLEKCTKPQSSCSFVSDNYKSSCTQVFNYHRLLTWDSTLGLHMDIFKVPTCCSCHVHGYSDIYPPHRKNPPAKLKETFPGADFITEDQPDNYRDFNGKPSNFITKQSPSANFDPGFLSDSSGPPSYVDDVEDGSTKYNYFDKKPFSESVPSRPTHQPPSRLRPKKQPSGISRPFDNLPTQHAPNTRAPGYTGPKIRTRPHRPFRRESNAQLDFSNSAETDSANSRYSQQFDQDVDATTRVQSVTFDEEYQEPPRRVNYNYHPIIDFFKPEASMLQSIQPQMATQPAPVQSSNSWKPMIST
ncbi:neurotrophin 1 [Athalia rosae]|uniref:neurotrophin 1 n=1 Tax=Athalia rosae TaxID=37344 RepID=UPI0020342C0D|nr:neurotrophin 1 [Athalia rosae]